MLTLSKYFTYYQFTMETGLIISVILLFVGVVLVISLSLLCWSIHIAVLWAKHHSKIWNKTKHKQIHNLLDSTFPAETRLRQLHYTQFNLWNYQYKRKYWQKVRNYLSLIFKKIFIFFLKYLFYFSSWYWVIGLLGIAK